MDAMKIKTETFTLRWDGPVHPTIGLLVGKLNAYTWRGHPAGHVLFSGLEAESTDEFRRKYEATFIIRKGRRWDEVEDISGEWHFVPSLGQLISFASLPIPDDAIADEPAGGEEFIVLPAGMTTWRDRPPQL